MWRGPESGRRAWSDACRWAGCAGSGLPGEGKKKGPARGDERGQKVVAEAATKREAVREEEDRNLSRLGQGGGEDAVSTKLTMRGGAESDKRRSGRGAMRFVRMWRRVAGASGVPARGRILCDFRVQFDWASHQRRRATRVQMASMRPKGQAPCRKP